MSIEYYVEDSSNTHFPDRSFDCVILCFALHENDAKERENIIKEVKRVLKEDGKFIITDFAYPRRWVLHPFRFLLPSTYCSSKKNWMS